VRRSILALISLAAVLALVGTGCGGGPSPQEQWADDVCTQIADWKEQIEDIVADVQTELESPGLDTLAVVRASVERGVVGTRQLATDLRALPAPPGENGETAKQVLDRAVDDVSASVDEVKAQADSLSESSSLSQAATTLASIAAEVSGVVEKAKSNLDSIGALASDLRDGFEDADSCQDLREDTGV
jgi:hypothetical protein